MILMMETSMTMVGWIIFGPSRPVYFINPIANSNTLNYAIDYKIISIDWKLNTAPPI